MKNFALSSMMLAPLAVFVLLRGAVAGAEPSPAGFACRTAPPTPLHVVFRLRQSAEEKAMGLAYVDVVDGFHSGRAICAQGIDWLCTGFWSQVGPGRPAEPFQVRVRRAQSGVGFLLDLTRSRVNGGQTATGVPCG